MTNETYTCPCCQEEFTFLIDFTFHVDRNHGFVDVGLKLFDLQCFCGEIFFPRIKLSQHLEELACEKNGLRDHYNLAMLAGTVQFESSEK